MKSSDVSEVVATELRSKGVPEWGGRSFNDCLTTPRIVRCEDHNGTPLDRVWLVFQESAGSGWGYSVLYVEEKQAFGLGVPGSSHGLVLIGVYGTFLETINSM
jgi:hypothetical protein